jgi:hypothetical protein
MANVAPLTFLSAAVSLDSSLEGWSLLDLAPTPEAPRVFRQHVAFSRAFSVPPVVQVGLVGLDVSKDDNLRVRVRAVDITSFGLTLEVETWWNTKIWSVDVSWLAIGI